MTLKQYKKKRDFKKTPEPKGKVTKKKNKKLLYIIQKHAASHLHYDFRLELNGVLLSWAVPKGPCLDPSVKRLAMHVEDHPVEYGSFEGIIPKGQYGGGTVMLWDKGEWFSADENPAAAYRKGALSFNLDGEKLKGHWKLVRMNNNDKTWLLIKGRDEYAKPLKKYDITLVEPNSVLTNHSIDEITENYAHIWGKSGLEKASKKKPLKKKAVVSKKISLDLKESRFPSEISPQLATLVDTPPVGKQWLHEIKFDGYRLIAFKKNGKTRLFTRNQHDWTHKFKSVAEAINKLPIKDIILDGEVVVLDDNQHSNFQLLQNALKENEEVNFIFYVFDLLYYDKYNLTSLPLIERKKVLQRFIPDSDGPVLRYSDHVIGSGKKIFNESCKLALEGIVSKDCQSTYLQKRTKNWLKVKCVKRQEFVIGGFTKPQNSRKFFGALLLGTYNKRKELVYNGNVGTGFTESSLKSLHALLEKNISSANPFTTKPPVINKVTWVKPVLVAEVEFTEWTKDGSLRHPSFKGLRSDKSAKLITKEIPLEVENTSKSKTKPGKSSEYKLTHSDKILYPEDKITKGKLAEYYDAIHEWILPYITNRPLTLVRCPENYKQCFFQKHIGHHASAALHEVTIKEKEGKGQYFYIKDRAGLLVLPQMGALELHTWNSKIDDIEYPDMLVFDLDPAPELAWKKVVQGALEVKEYLAELKLKSFVKTTGGKGLHVVVPIKPEFNWDEVKSFSKTFVELVAKQNSKKYLTKMTKSQRVGKIFLDYLRNQRSATAVAAYSTRARLHAPVSTPIEWDELTNRKEDTFYTLRTLPDRLAKLKKDPWRDFFKVKQSLPIK